MVNYVPGELLEKSSLPTKGDSAVLDYKVDLEIIVPLKSAFFKSLVYEYINDSKFCETLKKLKYKAVFQDPAALSRDLLETEPERAIMDACTQRYEMLLHGKDTVWAGNLLMKEWIPKVIKMTAKKRWEWAKDSGAELLVTASPSEWSVLNEVRPENMKLMTLEELVLEATKEEAEDA